MVKKIFLTISAILLIANIWSCGNSNQQKQDNTQTRDSLNTEQTTEQSSTPTTETTQTTQTSTNAEETTKNTNKKYTCVLCNKYFDEPGTCKDCGMELVENVEYKE